MYAAVPDDLVLLTEELERLGGGDARVGEIDVIVRVAPSKTEENASVHVQRGNVVVVQDEQSDSSHEATASLDENATEDDVFDSIGAPAVEWLWDGFNSSIVASGESGSGKSYTLVGEDCGLCGMILASIFYRRDLFEDPSAISVGISAWELRGENLVDLLSATTETETISKKSSQFNFSTILCPDLKTAIDVLRNSRLKSVNWHVEGEFDVSLIPNRAHGFLRFVLHNALDMRVSTLHIVDCVGENSSALQQDKPGLRTIAQQQLSFKRMISELCSHKKGSTYDSSRGTGVLTSSRETLLNRLVAPLIAGNCKSFLLVTVTPSLNSVPRTRSILKSFCAAVGIRCACVRMLDIQLQDLHFQEFGKLEVSRTEKSLSPLRVSILDRRQQPSRTESPRKVESPRRLKPPKPVWQPSGIHPLFQTQKKINSPLIMGKMDFSNGVIPVVRKCFAHNRMLYGESENHTMSLFKQMDRQEKGYLSELDLKRGMKSIGCILSDTQVKILIGEIDENGDGLIQPNELAEAIHEGGRNPRVEIAKKSKGIPSHIVRSRSQSISPRKSASSPIQVQEEKIRSTTPVYIKQLKPTRSESTSPPRASSLSPSNLKRSSAVVKQHNTGNCETSLSHQKIPWGITSRSNTVKNHKRVHSQLSLSNLDFSNGVAAVVRKVFAHNRMLYGESEDHTMSIFSQMDRQGKGFLTPLDLKRGLKKIGLFLTDVQIEEFVDEIDDNGDGKIQPLELCHSIHEGGRNPQIFAVKKSKEIPSHVVKKSPRSTRMGMRQKLLEGREAAIHDQLKSTTLKRHLSPGAHSYLADNRRPASPDESKSAQHKKGMKKLRGKKRFRSDIAAWSTQALEMETNRTSRLEHGDSALSSNLRGVSLHSPRLETTEDPPNILELKREITNIMNDLELQDSSGNHDDPLKSASSESTKNIQNIENLEQEPLVEVDKYRAEMHNNTSLAQSFPQGKSGHNDHSYVFDLLQEEKAVTSRLHRRINEIQNENLQKLTYFELELHNMELEKIELKRNLRRLEKESSYSDIFSDYEKEISSLSKQLSQMQQRCAKLEACKELGVSVALISSGHGDCNDSNGINMQDVTAERRNGTALIDLEENDVRTTMKELDEAKQRLRRTGVKILDLERTLKEVSENRDALMKKSASLEGKNAALRETQGILIKDKEDADCELKAMRMYVSNVDKERRRNALFSRFVRKHTSEMAPPPSKELLDSQNLFKDLLSTLQKELNVKLPDSLPLLSRLVEESEQLFTEIDRLRIREQDALDSLRNVIHDSPFEHRRPFDEDIDSTTSETAEAASRALRRNRETMLATHRVEMAATMLEGV